jgi:hypothetical protein
MRLSTASLSVGHNSPVETIKDVFYRWHGNLFISILLLSGSIQHAIVVELSHVIVWPCQCDGLVVLSKSKKSYDLLPNRIGHTKF